MINRFFIFIFLVVFALVPWRGSYAQNCFIQYESLVSFKKPFLGAYSVWDSVTGKDDYDEQFASGVRLDNNQIVVAGLREYRDFSAIGPNLKGKSLLIAEIDLRGRIVWDSYTKIAGLQEVHKILRHYDGYVVLATVQDSKGKSKAVLVFTDGRGKIENKKVIMKSGHSFLPRDIENSWDNKGFVMVASAEKNDQKGAFAVIYGLSGKGNVLWERSYRPGLNNILLSVSRSDERFYTMTGQIENARGVQSGWVMKVADGGDLIWQQQYSRGAGSRLLAAADFPRLGMVVAGQALPVGDGGSAAWVMMLNKQNGEIVWQRFYRDKQNSLANDVIVGDGDGVVSVVTNSKPLKPGVGAAEQFVRLLTIDSRGSLFSRDDYLNSEGANAVQLLQSRGRQRVLVGTTQQAYEVEVAEGEDPVTARSLQGWVVSSPAPEIFNDPCKAGNVQKAEGIGSADVSEPSVESIFP
ncbi:hypothetical protein N9Z27_03175 [Alphaproteobacteria bacterium]|nr:hypothetical protein [Alphaproteobacteria bacterium]